VDFRQKHNIVDTGTNGQLMNDQQLSQVNSQLILAQAATAEAKARYDRIQEVMKQDVPDSSMTDALNNPVIVKLREEYLSLVSHVEIWTQKYGPDHLAVAALRLQMRELQRSIKDQMSKIEQSYKNEYEIALAREQSLRKSLRFPNTGHKSSPSSVAGIGKRRPNLEGAPR
jgi:polysaccharide biosynthesis transport protein